MKKKRNLSSLLMVALVQSGEIFKDDWSYTLEPRKCRIYIHYPAEGRIIEVFHIDGYTHEK